MSRLEYLKSLLENDSRYKLTIFTIILLTGLILWYFRILMLFGLFTNPHGPNIWFGDFKAYYNAAKLYMNGENIYGNTGFYYPPLALLMFLPLACLSFEQACLIMAISNISLLILTALLISKILQHYNILLSKTKLLLVFVAIFLFYPVSTSFTAGQINILILFLITLFYYYLFVKGEKTVASVILSIATMIKVWPFVLIFLDFITPKAKGILVRSCVSLGMLTLVSLAVFGIPLHVEFLNTLFAFQSISLRMPEEVLHPSDALDTNASLSNMLFKLLPLFGVSNLYAIIILYGLKIVLILPMLYYLYYLCFSKTDEIKEIYGFTSLIILILMIANITWIYYGSFLVLSIALLMFVIKLNIIEKGLLLFSIAFFSIQQYVITISNMIEGVVKSAVYIASPTTYAYFLFSLLIIYMLKRQKTSEEEVECLQGTKL